MAVHKELITAGKFDEKFKRALLDYYNYGFKNFGLYDAKKRQTISEDWMRLNRVISDYLEWSEDRNKIMFASTDSQAMDSNPFHRVYRFCKYKPIMYPVYFLHTMAALSEDISLRGGLDSLDLDEDQRMHLEDVISNGGMLKTSDLIHFYTEEIAAACGDDKNKTPNNRLNDLAQIGLIKCSQVVGVKGGKGDRHWGLPELTMRKIIDAGNSVNEDFKYHLKSALDFFSKYYLFGEIGTFLLDRLGGEEISPFRFKHEYFMQSLNDFNLIDLLYAIEKGKWCRIKYSHGTAAFETDLLCFPLEIRVSNTQGREFLFYYEPFKRSYTTLRLEFIDSIEYYDGEKIKSILNKTGYHSAQETVETDIENARYSIKYSWGTSTTKKQEGNAIAKANPNSVRLQMAYNKDTDYYIANRLQRECRFGTVHSSDDNPYLDFSIEISDEVELRPWLRGYYSRIIACDGMNTDTFSLESDIEEIVDLLLYDKLVAPQTVKQNTENSKWEIPNDVKSALGNGVKAREHDKLFNEVFSIYYYIIADVFTQLGSNNDATSYTKAEIDRLIQEAFNKFYLKIGQETESLLPEEIKGILLSNGFVKKTAKLIDIERSNGFFRLDQKEVESYEPRYCCSADVELYKDVIPLSTMEICWLKSIIGDAKIQYFLTDEELNNIHGLLEKFASDISPLPMDKVYFFDRFYFSDKNIHREAAVLATLLEGIYDQRTVRLKYHTMRNRVMVGEFKPIVLEFSKRNNRFQGIFQSCGNDHIYTMNISRIETVTETDTPFDYSEAEQALVGFRKENTTSVEVEFYNVRNIVDRILTEFSPWKKRCSYDEDTGIYKLTIFYQKQDEIDLVIRLMGYGANIRFVDKTHAIYREIVARMNRQMELIREHRRGESERGTGENR